MNCYGREHRRVYLCYKITRIKKLFPTIGVDNGRFSGSR